MLMRDAMLVIIIYKSNARGSSLAQVAPAMPPTVSPSALSRARDHGQTGGVGGGRECCEGPT